MDPEDRIQITGNSQLLLNEPEVAWRVVSGRVAVFLVRLSDGQTTGSRSYLFTCRARNVLFPGANLVDGQSYSLMAVGLEDSEVEKLLFGGLATQEDGSVELDDWTAHLCEQIDELAVAVHAEKPGEDGRFELSEGQRLRAVDRSVHWLKLESGQMTLIGEPDWRIGSDSPCLPLTGNLWLRTESDAKGRLVSAPDLVSLPIRLQGLRLLSSYVFDRWHRRQRDLEREELERLARRKADAVAESQAAIRGLQLDKSRRYEVPTRSTPLLTALAAIGREMGIDFRSLPESELPPDRLKRVEALARASRVRTRRVRLTADWFAKDVGHLLAFRTDGSPVGLIHTRRLLGLSRSYVLFDPADGSAVRVADEVTDRLAADAVQFYRAIPFREKLSVLDISRFTFKPLLPDIGLLLGLSLVPALLGLAVPIANRIVMDDVIPDGNRRLLLEMAIGLSAVSIGVFVFSLSQSLVSLRLKTSLTNNLQGAVMDRLLRLSNRFLRSYSTGDLLNRSMMVSEISAGFSTTAIRGLVSGAMSLFQLALCYYYSSKLAWIAIGSALLTSVASVSFAVPIRRKSLAAEIKSGKLSGFVVQMINVVSKLQLAGAEQRAMNQWARKYAEQLELRNDISRLQQASGLLNTAIQTISLVILFYGAAIVLQKDAALLAVDPLLPAALTIGTFFAFQAAFTGVVSGVVGFFETFVQMVQHWAKRELVKPILEARPEVTDDQRDPGRLRGQVELTDGFFRYREDGPLILNSVSLHAHPGEFVALVGPSGSGKSTVMKLLLGFETLELGAVTFDGQDLRSVDVTAVRRQIGVVLQHGRINAGPIYQVIGGANPVSMEEAWTAARDAGFDADIESMPMGMHTVIAEGGATLSGGQRQRLLIARALVANPRILLFDEATSALDNRTQQIVSESLRRRKVTRIVVAHRLSTIRGADRIYVLEQGRIVEHGTYAELMEREGLFRRMVARQLA